MRESKGNAHGTQGERSNPANSNEYLLLAPSFLSGNPPPGHCAALGQRQNTQKGTIFSCWRESQEQTSPKGKWVPSGKMQNLPKG